MIKVINDPGLHKPTLEVRHNTEHESTTNVDPLKVFGILSPIIALDGMVSNFMDIKYMKLDLSHTLPSIELEIHDTRNLFESFKNDPKTIQLQILPAFEGKLKKINLLFSITKYSNSGGYILVNGKFKCNELYKSQWSCEPDISTFDLFKLVTEKTKLGFASNLTGSTNDKRTILINHKSYENVLKNELDNSIADETMVLDYWVDAWDYLNLVNIHPLYTDTKKELVKVPITLKTTASTLEKEEAPIEVPMELTNHPGLSDSDLYIADYDIKQDLRGYKKGGTSKVVSVYNMETREYVDHTVEMAEVDPNTSEEQSNIEGEIEDQVSYEYGGECYGTYDYLFSKQARDIFRNKYLRDLAIFTINKPLLSIIRGDIFKVQYFDNDFIKNETSKMMKDLKELGGELVENHGPDALTLNTQISGNYIVRGIIFTYDPEAGFSTQILSSKLK